MSEAPPDPSAIPGWKKTLLLIAAGLFFVLGVLGAILPGIPATPFLLLTSYCLVRSSPRLNDRLLRSRFFGPILKDWQQRGGVRSDIKVQAILVVLVAISSTIYLSQPPAWLALLICLMALIGIFVIYKLPTAGNNDD